MMATSNTNSPDSASDRPQLNGGQMPSGGTGNAPEPEIIDGGTGTSSTSSTEEGSSRRGASSINERTVQPVLDIIDDNHGPSPPVARSDVEASVEYYPTIKQRGGAPGLETFMDSEEPLLSTDAAAAAASIDYCLTAKKRQGAPGVETIQDFEDPPLSTETSESARAALKSDEPNLHTAPSPPNQNDLLLRDDEECGKMIQTDSQSENPSHLDEPHPSREEIEEELEVSLQSWASGGDTRRHAEGAHSEADSTMTIGLEHASDYMAEAWPVPPDDDRLVIEGIHVPPALPWWKQTQNKLYTWVLLCFLSSIALTAYKTNPDHEKYRANLSYNPYFIFQHSFSGWDTILTACWSISIPLSALASLAHVLPNNAFSRRFLGTIFEGATAFFVAVCCGLPLLLITDSSKNLAMVWVAHTDTEVADYKPSINDGNLYFSSWGSTICALTLFVMSLGEQREKILKCFRISVVPNGMGLGYTIKWILLVLASLLVIIQSHYFLVAVCDIEKGTEQTTCDRSWWGIVTGAIGIIISTLMSLWSYAGRDSARITTAIGFAMTVNFIFCAGMLCFGYGPATSPGNQFFATWAGVFLSLSLFGSALKEYMNEKSSEVIQPDAEHNENTGCSFGKKRTWVSIGIGTVGVIVAVIVVVTRASEKRSSERCTGISCYPDCPSDYIYPPSIGDGYCDGGSYNTKECGFDGGDCLVGNYPDCHVDSPSYIGDGLCNGGQYNTKECGFDGGDCIEFNEKYPDCRVDDPYYIGNSQCNNFAPYNTEECGFDGADCIEFNEKYPDCHVEFPSSDGHDGRCNNGPSNTEECGWDFGNCIEFNEKYPNCRVDSSYIVEYIGDGVCEGYPYNTQECGWEGGDCLVEKYPDCHVDEPSRIGDGHCDGTPYISEECGFDGGDCPDLHNCHVNKSFIGNGICDGGPYNAEECGWDGGDCLLYNYPDCHVDIPSYIGNGRCNGGPYNTEECGFDGGDCLQMKLIP